MRLFESFWNTTSPHMLLRLTDRQLRIHAHSPSPSPTRWYRPPPRARIARLAHGFSIEQLVELMRDRLATAKADRVVAGARKFEVATRRITDAGRKALEKSKRLKRD